jgi:toxin FitB
VYLVDTNVVSAGAPSRLAPAGLIEWMDVQSGLLSLSVVTIAEIEDGIAKLRRERATRKSADLATWLEAVLHLYGGRIHPFDTATARIAGTFLDRARGQGHAPGFADVIIAATAKLHGLTVLTRNVRHLTLLGVPVIDPYVALPPS